MEGAEVRELVDASFGPSRLLSDVSKYNNTGRIEQFNAIRVVASPYVTPALRPALNIDEIAE